jgi:charged multivesicular body protein 6
MGNLFGKHQAHPRRVAAPPAAEVTDHDRAVLDLKNTRDKLSRHRKKADKEAGKLAEQAKILVKEGRKDRALLLLKIKKFKMMHVEKVDMQLFQVIQSQLEFRVRRN